jgi:diaminopimelate epimerase
MSRFTVERLAKTQNMEIEYEDIFHVNIGNDHIIIFVRTESDFNMQIAKKISLNPKLLCKNIKEQINVTFATKGINNDIIIRTYERGAGETEGCGSAGCATYAAFLEFVKTQCTKKIGKMLISMPGGAITVEEKNQEILMCGEAIFVCKGVLYV